jgi:hypothetical protein
VATLGSEMYHPDHSRGVTSLFKLFIFFTTNNVADTKTAPSTIWTVTKQYIVHMLIKQEDRSQRDMYFYF